MSIEVSSRVCDKCKLEFPLERFATYLCKGRVCRRRVCKVCRMLQITPEAKERMLANCRERLAAVKKEIHEFMGGKCKRCNTTYPFCCYDFHHRDPATKEHNVARLLNSYSIRKRDVLFKELAKCDMLCANCHRFITWGDAPSQS